MARFYSGYPSADEDVRATAGREAGATFLELLRLGRMQRLRLRPVFVGLLKNMASLNLAPIATVRFMLG